MANEEIRKSPSGKRVEIEDIPPGTTPGDLLYWDGASWVPLAPPSNGSLLNFVNSAEAPSWLEGQAEGDILYYDGADWLRLPPGANSAVLQRASDIPAWTAAASATNAWLIFDSTTGLWVPSTVRERVFDNTYSPAGNWGLNLGSLADSSGNGFTLSVTGTERYSNITRTLGCARLLSTQLAVAGAQALLSPTGACSMLALCTITALPASQSLLVGYTTTGETEATNCQWGLFLESDGGITYNQENGLGVDSSHNVNSYATLGQLAMIGFTKTSGQVVQIYLNGRVWGAPSGALTTPTGGSSSRLRIANDGGAVFSSISIASVAFYNSTLTAAQVAERFNYSLGRSSGFI